MSAPHQTQRQDERPLTGTNIKPDILRGTPLCGMDGQIETPAFDSALWAASERFVGNRSAWEACRLLFVSRDHTAKRVR